MRDISTYIDHTLLKPTATIHDITRLCDEAIQFSFAAVCIPPPMVQHAKNALKGSTVKVATVIGFPFGYSTPKAKLAETAQAIGDGADELDVVINLIALKALDWKWLQTEMSQIIVLAHDEQRLVKVIIESGILTNQEIIACCNLYSQIGVDFVKTSTGYAEKGATVEAVGLMREHLPAAVSIKASGGIRTYAFAKQLINAGASRLGCSASLAIVEEFNRNLQQSHNR
ncbi:MAG TPA: deoxyribose-phosphate aldolase [Puia sp.]|nr:deoxyribose-phosphate aldolase [Puia sp.]